MFATVGILEKEIKNMLSARVHRDNIVITVFHKLDKKRSNHVNINQSASS